MKNKLFLGIFLTLLLLSITKSFQDKRIIVKDLTSGDYRKSHYLYQKKLSDTYSEKGEGITEEELKKLFEETKQEERVKFFD